MGPVLLAAFLGAIGSFAITIILFDNRMIIALITVIVAGVCAFVVGELVYNRKVEKELARINNGLADDE